MPSNQKQVSDGPNGAERCPGGRLGPYAFAC